MTNRATTTIADALLREALLELADGPDAGALMVEVLGRIELAPQRRGLAWQVAPRQRPVALVGLAVVLAAALVGGLLAAGALIRRPAPVPIPRANIVIQTWNGLRDPVSRVTHTVFSSAGTSTVLDGLPANAVGLRWSADGARLLYFEQRLPTDLLGRPLTRLFLSRRDGSARVEITLPRPLDHYASNGWWAGPVWAPANGRFALPWSTYTCSGSPDCIPDGGIDLFDELGNLLDTVYAPNDSFTPTWSPDGRAIGWTRSACSDSYCAPERFDWRLAEKNSPVTTLAVAGASQIVWAHDRLFVVVVSRDARVERVFSMDTRGGDVEDVNWPDIIGFPQALWSPDAESIVAVDTQGRLLIRNAASGATVDADVPAGLALAGWAPDGSSVILYGDSSSPQGDYGLFRIDADGSGLRKLGDGEDYGWLPVAR